MWLQGMSSTARAYRPVLVDIAQSKRPRFGLCEFVLQFQIPMPLCIQVA